MLHRDDCSGTLYLWVEDSRGTTKFAPTRYDIHRDEWNPVEGCIILAGDDVMRRRTLLTYAKSMVEDIRCVEEIVRSLEEQGHCRAGEVIRHYYELATA